MESIRGIFTSTFLNISMISLSSLLCFDLLNLVGNGEGVTFTSMGTCFEGYFDFFFSFSNSISSSSSSSIIFGPSYSLPFLKVMTHALCFGFFSVCAGS